MSIDKIYLINLERKPDRLEHFLNECKRENVDISKLEIFKAFDGKTHQFSDEELKMFDQCDFLGNYNYKLIMGNQLSHFYILKDMIKKGYERCIIFQDDVRFKKNFVKDLDNVLKNMPDDAEFVWIGLHKNAATYHFEDFPINTFYNMYYSKEKVNNYVCKLKSDINPCSLAYIVTRQGAINFVDHIEKYDRKFFRATDYNYNDYLESKNLMYCSNVILCTGNSNFKSDIFDEQSENIKNNHIRNSYVEYMKSIGNM